MKRVAVIAVAIAAALCLLFVSCTGEEGEVRGKYAALGYVSYDLPSDAFGLSGSEVDFVLFGVKDSNTESPSEIYVITFSDLDGAYSFEEAHADDPACPNLQRVGRAVIFGDADAVEAY